MQEELHLLSFLRGLADFLLPRSFPTFSSHSQVQTCLSPGGSPEPLSNHFFLYLCTPSCLATTKLYSVSINLSVLDVSCKWNHRSVIFGDGLLPLSITFQESLMLPGGNNGSFLFMA